MSRDARDMHVLKLVERITYKDWWFDVQVYSQMIFVQVMFIAMSVTTGRKEIQCGRRWLIEDSASDDAILRTCLLAVLTAEEHEARELFRVKGEAIFGPHRDLGAKL